jgi:hypothetical protein
MIPDDIGTAEPQRSPTHSAEHPRLRPNFIFASTSVRKSEQKKARRKFPFFSFLPPSPSVSDSLQVPRAATSQDNQTNPSGDPSVSLAIAGLVSECPAADPTRQLSVLSNGLGVTLLVLHAHGHPDQLRPQHAADGKAISALTMTMCPGEIIDVKPQGTKANTEKAASFFSSA